MKESNEEILIKALKLLEQGTPLERVLNTFSDESGELKQSLHIIEKLREEAALIVPPPPEFLHSIMRIAEANRIIAQENKYRFLKLLVPAFAVVMVFVLSRQSPANAPISHLPASSSFISPSPLNNNAINAVQAVPGGIARTKIKEEGANDNNEIIAAYITAADTEQTALSDTQTTEQAVQAKPEELPASITNSIDDV